MPRSKFTPITTSDPIKMMELTQMAYDNPRCRPDIITFVTSQAFLNRPYLYPRQATLLKVIFLEIDLLTDYDRAVIDQWKLGFKMPSQASKGFDSEAEATMRWEGDWGIVTDVIERMEFLRHNKYPWFSLVLGVLGRRSGKGYLGALCTAYVLWSYLTMSNPRDRFGIDRDKRLSCQVFAGKKMQARDNQWRDIVSVITGSYCFQDYISQSLGESLTIWSPHDKMIGIDRKIDTTMDLATFEIVPKEATTMAARGPASFCQLFDEMAHMTGSTGGSRAAKDVWDAATPSLDQFKKFQFIFAGSSPWAMSGQYYELCQQTLQVDAETLNPVYPENLLIQLESWDMYTDWERTSGIFVLGSAHSETTKYEDGPIDVAEVQAVELKGAIQEYDDRMRRLERANPDTFRVERRSKWATSMDAYFPEQHVRRMFSAWPGDERLVTQLGGDPTISYVMHGDPGKTGSNFGFAVAHKVAIPGEHLPHVVFDFIKGWMPGDFPNQYSQPDFPEHEMDYTAIEMEIKDLMDAFYPVDVSLDQWNSIGLVQRLASHSRQTSFKTVNVWERNVTASLNWKTAETMKTALSLNLVHAPHNDLLEVECLFLRKLPGDKVDHPSTGPCTTKDVYDAASICIHKLIGADVALYMGEELSSLRAVASMPGPNSPSAGITNSPTVHDQFSMFTSDRRQQRARNSMTPPRRRPR